ncbi:MAG TPA: HAMP domain-containing sensor histidine kinase [Candidatus Saccharimonadales bacterium]|nr:HAMP domain-containing sensor histidine kinase [Candidatus Saccharimonadales bacterium]
MTTNRFITATFRLTAWYLSILMFISIAFSAAIYERSSNELAANARRQQVRMQHLPNGFFLLPDDDSVDKEVANSESHLRASLIVYNLIILAAGGAASYWFARRTLRPIQNALEAQSRFTADASHELRTPLTAMKSEIEVALRDKNLSVAEARELLNSNLEEIDKLEVLSTSLLTLAHYEEGGEGVAMDKVELNPLVEKTLAKFTSIIKPRHITLKTELKALKLDADPTGLEELVTILVDNAIKYSPDGAEVLVRTFTQSHSAIIEVKDRGLGIKASEIPHLFERFYRADTSRSKTRVKGYGLGLSIAKSIVTAHQGVIEVSSAPGKGSTFTVKLPLSNKANELPV